MDAVELTQKLVRIPGVSGQEGDAHIIDEAVDVGEIAKAAEFYRNLVTGMAGA